MESGNYTLSDRIGTVTHFSRQFRYKNAHVALTCPRQSRDTLFPISSELCNAFCASLVQILAHFRHRIRILNKLLDTYRTLENIGAVVFYPYFAPSGASVVQNNRTNRPCGYAEAFQKYKLASAFLLGI
jgi:hypothetical protein